MSGKLALFVAAAASIVACGNTAQPKAHPEPAAADAAPTPHDIVPANDADADSAPDAGNKWAQADGCQRPAVMFDEGPPAPCLPIPGCVDCTPHCAQPWHPSGKPCSLDKCWDPPLHVCSALPDNVEHLFCKPDGTLCCAFGTFCVPCGWVTCDSQAVDARCPKYGNAYHPGGNVKNPAGCKAYEFATPEHMQMQFCMDDYDDDPKWCSHATHDDDYLQQFPEGVVPVWMQDK